MKREPKFRDYNIKTRKCINKILDDYLNGLRFPKYFHSKKYEKSLMNTFRIWLRKNLIENIYDVDLDDYILDDSYLIYLVDFPFRDIVSIRHGEYEEAAEQTSYKIPSSVVHDIIFTRNFYRDVLVLNLV